MDLQGQQIPPGKRSTKATDPRTFKDQIKETSGPVTNDSLAAESIRSGGGFSENRGAEPLGVSGDQSTFRNTDTSRATTLPSVPDGASSRGEDQPKTERYPEALGGQGSYPGAHVPETGYVGGSTKAKKDLGLRPHEYAASQKTTEEDGGAAHPSGYRSKYNGGEAPTYMTSVLKNVGNTWPNGQNLREGGFNNDDRYNASFNSDIGSKQDPGRLAENYYARDFSQTVGAAADGGPTQKGLDKQTWYQPLKRDQSA